MKIIKPVLWGFLLFTLTGCGGGVATQPSSVEQGPRINFRSAAPYLDVTDEVLQYIDYVVNEFIPQQVLDITVTLLNPTDYHPLNLMMIFEPSFEEPDGMTDRGFGYPHRYRLFNDGHPIETGVPYVENIRVDISGTGFIFDVFVWGLFGADKLTERFVYQANDDYYDYTDKPIYIARLNGKTEYTGIDGRFPNMSGNGRFVAAFYGPWDASSCVILDMVSDEATFIYPPEIPGALKTTLKWGVFDYEGKYFAYQAGEPQLREYLYLRNMASGETTIIEGAQDGSKICGAFSANLSGDGSVLAYTYIENPTSGVYPHNIFTYYTATGEKIQRTSHPVVTHPMESWPESLDFYGKRLLYREGYFTQYGQDWVVIYDLKWLDLDTGDVTLLYESQGIEWLYDAVWPWDGRHAYYALEENQFTSTYSEIYRIDIFTKEITQVTKDKNLKFVPFISGDGLYGGIDVVSINGGVWGMSVLLPEPWQVVLPGMWPSNGIS